MQDMIAKSTEDSAEPTISFDKDDEDTLDFVAASANIRSIVFGIEPKSRFDIKQMAGNIIPAIATTNAIVAGLCVLQSFKVLRGEYASTKEIFLSPFASERLLAYEPARKPNPECPVCSVAQARLLVDLSRATLNDLVEDFLRGKLGYGEEFVVNNEVGLLYDVDETENLEKKLSELGIKDDSFLTIIDENEEEPRVNLLINIHEALAAANEKPIKPVTDEKTIEIPKRPRLAADPYGEINDKAQHTDAVSNGLVGTELLEPPPTKKRTASELGDGDGSKPGKAQKTSKPEDDVIVLDSADDGAIVIED